MTACGSISATASACAVKRGETVCATTASQQSPFFSQQVSLFPQQSSFLSLQPTMTNAARAALAILR